MACSQMSPFYTSSKDIRFRYPETDIFVQETHQAKLSLSQAVERIQQELDKHWVVVHSRNL
jgi:hypothetical protein